MPTHDHSAQSALSRPVLTVRVHAGLNAGSLLAGLFAVSGMARFYDADDFFHGVFAQAPASLRIQSVSVCGIGGVSAGFVLPEEHREHGHVHRAPAEILHYYETASSLSPAALELTERIWLNLAKAEAAVHGVPVESVHFHEVGRMSNVWAIGLIAELFAAINPRDFVTSPLPLADGTVRCAHGFVPNPAPATLAQLEGVAVRAYEGKGETVSPTGLAALKGLGVRFGAWPDMCVCRQVTAFTADRVFEGANGLVFALGQPL